MGDLDHDWVKPVCFLAHWYLFCDICRRRLCRNGRYGHTVYWNVFHWCYYFDKWPVNKGRYRTSVSKIGDAISNILNRSDLLKVFNFLYIRCSQFEIEKIQISCLVFTVVRFRDNDHTAPDLVF